jgi:N-acetylglucosamine-6-phosphate deacetylase
LVEESDGNQMTTLAFHGGPIAGPKGWVQGQALIVADGKIQGFVGLDQIPADARNEDLDGDVLAAGFIDIQVNGGGGVLFNDDPSVETIAKIGGAHAAFGTTGFFPTLISDSLDKIKAAIGAVDAAIAQGIPGVLGIHLEGPFLNEAKKGVHDASTFRVLDDAAILLLTSLKNGKTLITLAPEKAPSGAIAKLVARGAIVFAGHSDATFEQVEVAKDDGLSGFTHIFNAMSQLGSRAPGVVGSALRGPNTFAGLIADGVHVHAANMELVAELLGKDHTILVTDAMPTVGSDADYFELGDQVIVARGDTCYTDSGVLAGSNLNMAQAVVNMTDLTGVDQLDALAMASATPALAMGLGDTLGQIAAGYFADLVSLDEAGKVTGVWMKGVAVRL